MKPMRFPSAVVKLRSFLSAMTATHGQAVEFRQDPHRGLVATASDGRHLARVTVPAGTAETIEPLLVDKTVLGKAATAVGCGRAAEDPAARDLLVVRLDDKNAIIAGPAGEPQTVPLEYGAYPDCDGVVDSVQGEAASGMTRAVARLDPRWLQHVADAAVAVGVETLVITFAPRWNTLLLEGAAPGGVEAVFAIAGVGEVISDELKTATATGAAPEGAGTVDDPLEFTVADNRRESPRRRSSPKPPAGGLSKEFLDDLPF